MTQLAAEVPIKTTLVDITKCIGCRACQVACKQWNDRDGEETQLDFNLGFQNPATLSANTLTLITFHELPDEKAPGGLHYLFTMRRCLHCLEPACASACPTTALDRRSDGPVIYDANKCIGCRYCIWACPWGVPTAEWDSLAPKIQKCTHCADRSDQPVPLRPQRAGTHPRAEQIVTAKTLSRRLASRRARLIVCVSGPGKKSCRRRTTAFPPTLTSTWTTSTEKKKRAARAFYICPLSRSTKSGFLK